MKEPRTLQNTPRRSNNTSIVKQKKQITNLNSTYLKDSKRKRKNKIKKSKINEPMKETISKRKGVKNERMEEVWTPDGKIE